MQLTHQRVDLDAEAMRAGQLGAFFEKRPGEQWLVAYSPIDFESPIDWRICRRGDLGYVPLVPYLAPCDHDLALAYMLQLGFGCARMLNQPCRRLHLVTGFPVKEVTHPERGPMWQFLCGLAAILES